MMRHGEFGVLTIIEQIERIEGIKDRHLEPLENRWQALMLGHEFANQQMMAV
jgi:hypothetical protein